jgi:transcription antitermination factor NusG
MDNLVIVPMFRGYIFAKLNLEQFFRLGRIHGVQSLVSFDGPPPAVEEAFIDQLRSRMGKDGVIRLGAVSRKGPEFLRGEKVQIDAGPFLGYTGIFQEGLDSDGRVKVLLDSLYSSTMQPIVQVPRSYVARIHAH